jgi:histidinol-phosphate phosphatase family protein
LIVLTNQPVIARGEATEEEVDAIHSKLEWELGKSGAYLDGIYICPHHPDKGFPGERPELKGLCECRKPSTGLLVKACQELAIDPANSWMIGDTTSDLEMARRGGLRSILVQTGVAGRDEKYSTTPDHTAVDLDSAADFVLSANRARPALATS